MRIVDTTNNLFINPYELVLFTGITIAGAILVLYYSLNFFVDNLLWVFKPNPDVYLTVTSITLLVTAIFLYLSTKSLSKSEVK